MATDSEDVARPSIRICEKLLAYCRKHRDEAEQVVENLELCVDALRNAIICGRDGGERGGQGSKGSEGLNGVEGNREHCSVIHGTPH